MANKDAAFGLRPARMMGGAPYSGGQSRYRIANNQSGAIFQGDLVKQLTGGTVSRAAASSTVPVVGVFNGVSIRTPQHQSRFFLTITPALSPQMTSSVWSSTTQMWSLRCSLTIPSQSLTCSATSISSISPPLAIHDLADRIWS